MLQQKELQIIKGRKIDFFIKVIAEIWEFLFQLCHRLFCDPDLWFEFVSLEFNRSFVIVFPGIGVI